MTNMIQILSWAVKSKNEAKERFNFWHKTLVLFGLIKETPKKYHYSISCLYEGNIHVGDDILIPNGDVNISMFVSFVGDGITTLSTIGPVTELIPYTGYACIISSMYIGYHHKEYLFSLN